jgi:type I restriction enzyme S subunit
MNAQDLKNSILQLAIQGKLVEQREEEGTAKELLEQIKAEKEQLIKEGKIKKEKPLPEIAEDEIPFEIPWSWEWVRLRDLGITQTGNTPSKAHMEYFGDFIPFVSPGDILNGIMNYRNQGLSEKGKEVGRVSEKYSILQVCIGGSIGKCAINTMDVTYNQQINAITPIISDYLYLYYLMDSKFFLLNMKSMATGTATPIINKSAWESLTVPLPPLEEQKRIVAKIEELMPYVEKYGEAHSELEVFNKKFQEDMQKSILQYAIQGKLVEQRGEEGTAEEMYQQIQEEKAKLIKEGKIKKEKPLAEITDNEIPFAIPEGWKWVRLGNVIDLLSGQDFSPEKYNGNNKGIPYITGASSLSNKGVIVNRWTEEPRCIANAGDVLLVCKGSGYGKTVVCDVEKAHIARQIMSIKYSKFINMMYFKHFMSANYALIKKWGQGVIPGIDRKSIKNMLFPLPPVEEQKRIVAKIEELMPYCQQLVK